MDDITAFRSAFISFAQTYAEYVNTIDGATPGATDTFARLGRHSRQTNESFTALDALRTGPGTQQDRWEEQWCSFARSTGTRRAEAQAAYTLLEPRVHDVFAALDRVREFLIRPLVRAEGTGPADAAARRKAFRIARRLCALRAQVQELEEEVKEFRASSYPGV